MRFTIWNTGGEADEYFAIAAAAERSGWTSMCLNEGLFQPKETEGVYPFSADGKRFWTTDTPYLEPLTLLTAVAATTERLRFYPFVMKLTLRNPLVLAKAIATASAVSHGRLSLGVGMSWMPEEYALCGIDWDTRRQRFVESVEVLRLVLTGEMVEYHGEVFDFGPLQSAPGSVKPMPIYIGGHRDLSLRLAAQYADGWAGIPSERNELAACISRLHELLREQGRSVEAFGIHANVTGTETVDDYRRLEDMGVTDAVVTPWAASLADTAGEGMVLNSARKVELTERFGERIIARLSEAR
jgi:probable F420-dependent oxidoreductase